MILQIKAFIAELNIAIEQLKLSEPSCRLSCYVLILDTCFFIIFGFWLSCLTPSHFLPVPVFCSFSLSSSSLSFFSPYTSDLNLAFLFFQFPHTYQQLSLHFLYTQQFPLYILGKGEQIDTFVLVKKGN